MATLGVYKWLSTQANLRLHGLLHWAHLAIWVLSKEFVSVSSSMTSCIRKFDKIYLLTFSVIKSVVLVKREVGKNEHQLISSKWETEQDLLLMYSVSLCICLMSSLLYHVSYWICNFRGNIKEVNIKYWLTFEKVWVQDMWKIKLFHYLFQHSSLIMGL